MTLSTRALLPLLLTATLAIHGCGDKDGGDDTSGGGSGDDGGGDDGGSDLPPEGTNAGECTDGADNDADGLFDCNDPDCAGSPDCSEANTPGGCSDGADNDQDGLFDCDDPDCAGDEACGDGIEGNDAGECEDGIDNDGDGLTDCEDDDCAGFEGCDDYEGDEPGECTDGEDNDSDGLTDCDDDGCAGSPDCEPSGAAVVINGGAEDGTSGWSASSGVGAVGSANNGPPAAYEGDYFFSLGEGSASSPTLVQEGSGTLPTSLTITGQYRTSGADTARVVLSVLDSSNNVVAEESDGSMVSVGAWSEFRVTVTVPSSGAAWKVSLEGVLNEGSYTNVYYDDVAFE